MVKKNEMFTVTFNLWPPLLKAMEDRADEYGLVISGSLFVAAVHYFLEFITSYEEFVAVWDHARNKHGWGDRLPPQSAAPVSQESQQITLTEVINDQ